MKYEVEIVEELSRLFEVEADSPQEAYEKVHKRYHNEEIILDGQDLIGTTFYVINDDGITESEWVE